MEVLLGPTRYGVRCALVLFLCQSEIGAPVWLGQSMRVDDESGVKIGKDGDGVGGQGYGVGGVGTKVQGTVHNCWASPGTVPATF